MIGEDEKRRIIESMARAFNRQAIQHYADIIDGTAHGDPVIEDRFLQVRMGDIDSYMRVLERRGKSKPISKHRPMLARAAILSMADGAFTLPDLGHGNNGRGPDGGHGSRYTDRHRQRLLRERYKDVFFEPDPRAGGTKRISSAFSENNPPRSPAVEQARAYVYSVHQAMRALWDGNSRRQLALRSILRSAFPQFLEELVEFRGECRAVFESIGKRNDRIDFLREQLVDDPRLLDVFYSHTTSMLDLAWFRTLPKNERDLYLRPASRTRYTRQDVGKARSILVGIHGRDRARSILDMAGIAFIQIGRPSAAVWLYGECLEVSKTGMERGLALQNAAAAHRMNQNFKLALTCMKNALAHFESTGDIHKICNALQLVGENQWRLGFRGAATKSFGEMERRGAERPEGERWRTQYMLGMSFGRLGETRRSRRYLTRALEMIPEEETEWIIRVNDLILSGRPVWTDEMLPAPLSQGLDACVEQSDEWVYGKPGPVRPAGCGARDPGGDA